MVMITSILESHFSSISAETLKPFDTTLEMVHKVSIIAKKIFWSITIGLALLSGSHFIATISNPMLYFTLYNIGIEMAGILSLVLAKSFGTIEKISLFFKNILHKVSELPDLTNASKLLFNEIPNLPPEVNLLVEKYKEECRPYAESVKRKLKELALSMRKLQGPQDHLTKNEIEKIKGDLVPLLKELYVNIQPFFEDFSIKLIENYAYPKYLNYSQKHHLKILDKIQYTFALHRAMRDVCNTKAVLSLNEIVENPGRVRNGAYLRFFESTPTLTNSRN